MHRAISGEVGSARWRGLREGRGRDEVLGQIGEIRERGMDPRDLQEEAHGQVMLLLGGRLFPVIMLFFRVRMRMPVQVESGNGESSAE